MVQTNSVAKGLKCSRLSLSLRVRHKGQGFGTERRLKLALSNLEGERFDEGCLLAFVQAQLAGALVDQFKLPGHQGEAIFEGVERLGMQVDMILRLSEQAVQVQAELG